MREEWGPLNFKRREKEKEGFGENLERGEGLEESTRNGANTSSMNDGRA